MSETIYAKYDLVSQDECCRAVIVMQMEGRLEVEIKENVHRQQQNEYRSSHGRLIRSSSVNSTSQINTKIIQENRYANRKSR